MRNFQLRFWGLLFLLAFPAASQAAQLPDVVRAPLEEVIGLTGKKDFQGALDVLQKATEKAQGLTSLESLIFGQLKIQQMLNLESWDEAQTMALTLLADYEDLFAAYGFFTFGQRVAAQSVMERLYKTGQHQQVVDFAFRILVEAPQWNSRVDHTMAGFWSTLGDSQWALGESEMAIESWARSQACWETKKELWRQEEPERFQQFNGLDRYNPLQVAIEAKLVGAYLKRNQKLEAEAIRSRWEKQYQVMFEAHEGDKGEMAAKIFYRSIESNLSEAESLLPYPGLAAEAMISKNASCVEVLKPTSQTKKEK